MSDKRGTEVELGPCCTQADDAHGIIPAQADVGQAQRQGHREGELVVARGRRHRGGRVDEEVERRLALGAEGLDEELVQPAVGVPIQVAQVVAGAVGFVVLQLDAGTLRAARHRRVAGPRAQRAAHDEMETVELAQKCRRQHGGERRPCRAAPLAQFQWRRRRAAWSTRSISARGSIPSATAAKFNTRRWLSAGIAT